MKIRYLVLLTVPIWSPVTPRAYSITIPSWYVEISAPVPVIPASQIQRPPLRIPGEPIPPKRRRGRPPKPEQGIGTSENPRGPFLYSCRPRQQAIGGVESGNQKVTRSIMKVSRECFDSISSTLQDLRIRVIHLGNNLEGHYSWVARLIILDTIDTNKSTNSPLTQDQLWYAYETSNRNKRHIQVIRVTTNKCFRL